MGSDTLERWTAAESQIQWNFLFFLFIYFFLLTLQKTMENVSNTSTASGCENNICIHLFKIDMKLHML